MAAATSGIYQLRVFREGIRSAKVAKDKVAPAAVTSKKLNYYYNYNFYSVATYIYRFYSYPIYK